jgi:hypothetical protein
MIPFGKFVGAVAAGEAQLFLRAWQEVFDSCQVWELLIFQEAEPMP